MASKKIRDRTIPGTRERHRHYHGTANPESEVDLSIHAPRREISYPKGYKIPEENGTESQPIQLYSQEELDAEMDDCHWCQLAQFSTHLLYPVTITNEVDDATFPKNFRFIEFEEIRDTEVPVAEDDFRTGCDCENDGQCEYSGCLCLQDIYIDPASVNRKGPRRKINAYISKGPKTGCLKKEMLESREPLYECHSKCSCSEDCSNRVVERGRRIPLEIFRTADGRGWGVRSSANIQEGQFIDRYVGEIITAAEAQRRREESEVARVKDVYLFALDKFSDEDSMDPNLAGPPFEIDGEYIGGPTRFINHSCDPNIRIFARVGDYADKHIHDLAFFAIRNIHAGEELTFDYVDGGSDTLEEDVLDASKRQEMTKCLCGSKHCRGYLW